ncbi:MAG: tetratricopeptide repeat protein [Pirellulales bacterium]
MSSRQTCLVVSVALVAATFVAYAPVWRNDFVNIDDGVYIWQNPHVQQGFTRQAVRWAFDLSFRDDWRPYEANWHPLTWLSHMLDCQLFGAAQRGASPRGHHAMNVLLHATSAVCLFWALVRLTRGLSPPPALRHLAPRATTEAVAKTTKRSRRQEHRKGEAKSPRDAAAPPPPADANVWASALVAALFALHPLHVESVAWAAERKEVLCGLFWWLTLLVYAGWARRPTLAQYLLAICLFALGLMSKPMIVMLPAVLLLLDYWPLGRLTASGVGSQAKFSLPAAVRCVVEKWPFYLLSLGSAYITYHVQQHGGTTKTLEPTTLPVRLANAALSTTAYLRQTFWPTGLAVFYPHPYAEIEVQGWGAPGVLVSVVAIVAVTVAALLLWRRWPWLFTGWFWYLATLVPVIGIVQVGRQARADRYTYIPLVGIFIALAWGAAALVAWLERRATPDADNRDMARRPLVVTSAVVAALVLVACLALTWRQVGVWRDDLTLFDHALAVTARNETAEMNYGTALLYAGKPAEAVPHLAQAVELRPDHAEGWRNYGASLALSGNVAEGIAKLRRAVEIEPKFALAARDLAKILATTYDDSTRNGAEALRWARHADALFDHQDVETLGVLAMAQAESGDLVAAQKTALYAAQLAQRSGRADEYHQLQAQAMLYRSGQPLRLRWGPK